MWLKPLRRQVSLEFALLWNGLNADAVTVKVILFARIFTCLRVLIRIWSVTLKTCADYVKPIRILKPALRRPICDVLDSDDAIAYHVLLELPEASIARPRYVDIGGLCDRKATSGRGLPATFRSTAHHPVQSFALWTHPRLYDINIKVCEYLVGQGPGSVQHPDPHVRAQRVRVGPERRDFMDAYVLRTLVHDCKTFQAGFG